MGKLIGALLVAAGSLLGGLARRRELGRRLGVLRQLELALELMKAEMELSLPPLEELFRSVGGQVSGPVGRMLLGAAEEMGRVRGRSPQAALRISLDRLAEDFSPRERSLVLELGGCLGRYEPAGQLRALSLYQRRLEVLRSAGEQSLRRQSRAALTASLCGGLALIVMLV